MWYLNVTLAVTVAAALHLPASRAMAASPAEATKVGVGPVQIQSIDGSKLRRVTLTQKAAERLDIKAGQVTEEPSGRKVAPYASIFYDLAGEAWVYTNPAPLTYVRYGVEVEAIKGADAYLKSGPPAGTQVVTVGVAQLYGAEKGVGH